MKKTALIVSHMFPPVGGIGVQRPLKFVRYLRECGWEPVVLTAEGVYSATMDPSLLSQVPAGIDIVRVRDPLAKLAGRVITATTASESTYSPKVSRLGSAKRLFRKALKELKSELLIPDESILWALYAGLVGQRLVVERGISCVYTTSGPNSSHLAGLIIKSGSPVKWIADFRDPWTDNLHYDHKGWQTRIERSLERRVFRRADAVTTVTNGFVNLFTRKDPSLQTKLHVIRNGVDPNDFPPSPTETSMGVFKFFYAGILYPKRSPEPFLRALASLIRAGKIDRTRVRAQFAGVFDYPGQSANSDLVRSLGLEDVVEVLGYMPHHEVLRVMQSVDGLLLIGERGEETNVYIPGKLYEYLYAKRPIIALMPDGEAASLIREADAGMVLSADDEEGIAQAIFRLVDAHFRGSPKRPISEAIHQYTRQAQTQQLAELMDKLTDASTERR